MKNKNNIIVSISSMKDIDHIDNNTKYININITNPDIEIISFFLKNGEKYLYSETINDKLGYNYVSYEEFSKAETIINGIYADMPNDLDKLEQARYLYVSIPKYVYSDINSNEKKNDSYRFSLNNSIDNIWGSISSKKVNDKSISKIYYYLLNRLGINTELITSINNDTYIKLNINKMNIITDIYNDIPFIQAMMKTNHFGSYNDDTELDKKVKYIKTKYNDELIDKALKEIDYTKEDFIENILLKTEKIFKIDMVMPVELSILYGNIFKKYCPNKEIKINNLFLNNKSHQHFIIISYGNNYYSYNYKQHEFAKIKAKDLENNLNTGKIGIYLNEFIPNISNV